MYVYTNNNSAWHYSWEQYSYKYSDSIYSSLKLEQDPQSVITCHLKHLLLTQIQQALKTGVLKCSCIAHHHHHHYYKAHSWLCSQISDFSLHERKKKRALRIINNHPSSIMLVSCLLERSSIYKFMRTGDNAPPGRTLMVTKMGVGVLHLICIV